MSILPILGGVLGLFGSNKAAKAQEQAAAGQLALQREVYEDTTEKFAPFYDTGLDYQNALRFELLGGDRPTFGGSPLDVVEYNEVQPHANFIDDFLGGINSQRSGGVTPNGRPVTRYRVGDQVFDSRASADAYAEANGTGGNEYQGFQTTPGYQFALDQGQNAIDTSAAARGNLFSGATLKAQQEYGTGIANQEYGNYLNRLSAGAAGGQAAAGNLANAGTNFAQMGSTSIANAGNAKASGIIGGVNAMNQGLNNYLGWQNYQNNLAQPQQQSGGLFGGIFG